MNNWRHLVTTRMLKYDVIIIYTLIAATKEDLMIQQVRTNQNKQ